MPPQNGIEHRLDELEEKVDKSYRILKSVRRRQLFDFWFGIFKILLFVGAFYYAYVFLQPYVDDIKDLYFSIEALPGTFDFFEMLKGSGQAQ